MTLFHTATCYTAKNIGYIGVFRHTDFTDYTDIIATERTENAGIKERKRLQNLRKIQKKQKEFSPVTIVLFTKKVYATRLSKTKKNQEKLIKTGWVQIKTCFSLFAFVFLGF